MHALGPCDAVIAPSAGSLVVECLLRAVQAFPNRTHRPRSRNDCIHTHTPKIHLLCREHKAVVAWPWDAPPGPLRQLACRALAIHYMQGPRTLRWSFRSARKARGRGKASVTGKVIGLVVTICHFPIGESTGKLLGSVSSKGI